MNYIIDNKISIIHYNFRIWNVRYLNFSMYDHEASFPASKTASKYCSCSCISCVVVLLSSWNIYLLFNVFMWLHYLRFPFKEFEMRFRYLVFIEKSRHFIYLLQLLWGKTMFLGRPASLSLSVSLFIFTRVWYLLISWS